MALIRVTSRDGAKHEIEAPAGDPLMWTLRDNNIDVEAVCGGAASCATCHIYVAAPWRDQLPAPDDMETALLEDLVHVRPESRLSCQITMTEELNGMTCEVAPYED